MNCLDFRRQRGAGVTLSDAARAHAQACAGCREFDRRSAAFDEVLRGALTTPVPDGLADRVLFQRHTNWPRRALSLALAASVLLFITIAAQPFWLRGLAPADALLAHVLVEEQFERVFAHQASGDAMPVALREAGFNLAQNEVEYLGVCPVPGGKGHHFVVHTAQGEASLILIPAQRFDQPLEGKMLGKHALVLPAKRGSYALIGNSRQNLEQLNTSLNSTRATSI